MRKIFIALLGVCSFASAQVPIAGHLVVPSSSDSTNGQTNVVMSDADCTLTAPSGCTVTTAQGSTSSGDAPYTGTLYVTSSTLTATRNIIAPLSPGRSYFIKNSTTGGQLVCVKGSSGTAACIPSTQSGIAVCMDGANYTLISSGNLGGTSIAMSDADYTLSSVDALYNFITFSGSLTATRSIFAPATLGQSFTVTNTTAQTLWFHASVGGTGVFILSGQNKTVTYNGTGYIEPPVSNPFLASFNLAGCSTLYVFPVGVSGTTANNQCASQATSNRNGTIIGSPTVSQYGLVLNPAGLGTFGQVVQLPTSENAWKTMIIAGYFPNWGTSLGVNWGDTFSFPTNGSLLGGTNSNLTTTVDWNPASQPGREADSLWTFRPTGHNQGMNKPIPLGWHVITLVCDTGGGTAQYYVDGNAYPMSATNVTTCPTSTATGNQQIGGTSLFTNTWKSMILAGSETYYTARSPLQIYEESQAWLNYMKSNVQQPQSEQYTGNNSPPVLMLCCDSRTVSSTAPPGLITHITLDDTSAVIKLSASSGTALYDVCTMNTMPDLVSLSPDISNPLAAKLAIIVWAGVNDFIHGNYVTNNGAAYYSCVARQLRQLNPNATLFLATEIDACNPSDDPQKNATNPYILNQVIAWGYNGGIVNLNSIQVLGADGACSNATYFQPASPHPTDFANQIAVGPAYSNAINEAWGSNTQNFNVHDSSAGTTYTELAKDGALRLTGSLAQTITLPDCQGYSHVRTIWNDSSVTSTLLPGVTGMGGSFTQLISGQSSISLPPASSTEVEPIPGPSSTGTCTYRLKSRTTINSGSGTVSSGLSNQMARYAANGTTVSASANVLDDGTTHTVNEALSVNSPASIYLGANGTSLSLSNGGAAYTGPRFDIQMLGTATSGTNFNSLPLYLHGSTWTGSTPQTDDWSIQDVVGTGANPTSTLTINHTGGISSNASVSIPNQDLNAASITTPAFRPNATQTVVNCSTSGTVTYSEPFSGPSYKQVVAYAAACVGTASYTYPIPFSISPDVEGGLAGISSANASSVTVTGTTSTGWVFLKGY